MRAPQEMRQQHEARAPQEMRQAHEMRAPQESRSPQASHQNQSRENEAAHNASSQHEQARQNGSQNEHNQANGEEQSRRNFNNPQSNERQAEAGRERSNGPSENFRTQSHMEPITASSSRSVQNEHQNAMRELQGNHTSASSDPSARGNHMPVGHMMAGAAAGAAVAGLTANHMAGQRNEQNVSNERAGNAAGHASGPNQNGGGKEHAKFEGPGSAGTKGAGNIPPSPAGANPRTASRRQGNQTEKTAAGRLSYRSGTSIYPKGGDKKQGIPGVYDPGGYVRTPQHAETKINQDYARQQLAMNPHWQNDMSKNEGNRVGDRSQWPWHLPQQSTWWNPSTWRQSSNQYNGNQNGTAAVNPYAPDPYAGNTYNGEFGNGANPYGGNGYGANGYGGNGYGYGGNGYGGNPYGLLNPYFGYPYGVNGASGYWNNWNNYDDWNNWNNQYDNAGQNYGGGTSGLFGMLGGLLGNPQGVGIGSGDSNNWMDNLIYSQGYSTGGNTYPAKYFAMNGNVPTPYVFNVASGQFWQPGVGYNDALPADYRAPITVSVEEVVPSFDNGGKITGYQPQTFYNDAYWDNDAQSYGYYDYRKKFHWAKFGQGAS